MYFYCSKNSLSELIIFFSILSTFIIVQFCEEVAENQLLALFHPKQRLEWFSMWSHAQRTAGCWSFFRQSCNWLVASFRGDVQYQREEFQKLFRGYSVQAPHTATQLKGRVLLSFSWDILSTTRTLFPSSGGVQNHLLCAFWKKEICKITFARSIKPNVVLALLWFCFPSNKYICVKQEVHHFC